MIMANKKVFFVLPLFIFFIFTSRLNAATISLLPQARTFGIGQEFSVDIKIDTEEMYINAGQATLIFPVDILELSSVDKSSSVFSFWPDEPKISNDEGVLNFTGGTAKGISGGALQILKINFKAKRAGFAELTLRDAAVTASDGKGTNVLEEMRGGVFYVQDPPESFPDLNGDNRVDLSDLAILIFNWRGTQNLRYDINGDGQVGIRDISILISSLGKTRPQ